MEEIDLKEVFKTFWNKKIHIIIILVLFLIAGIIFTLNFVTPEFTSSTTLILASVNTGSSSSSDTNVTDTSVIEKDITVNSKLVSTYSEIIKSKKILRQVMANLDINNLEEDDLRKSISVSTVEDTELIQISVTNENAEEASEIANEIANVFKEKIKDYYDIENVQIVDEAEVEDMPSNINHKKDVAIFILVGIVVSCGYVLILNMLDTTIKSIEDVENITALTVIAAFPTYDNSSVAKPKSKKLRGGKRNER